MLQVLNEELELIFFISHEMQQKMEAIVYLYQQKEGWKYENFRTPTDCQIKKNK
jgi:hypothetical protein